MLMFYAGLHIGPKASVNLVPAIYTSLPRALMINIDCHPHGPWACLTELAQVF